MADADMQRGVGAHGMADDMRPVDAQRSIMAMTSARAMSWP